MRLFAYINRVITETTLEYNKFSIKNVVSWYRKHNVVSSRRFTNKYIKSMAKTGHGNHWECVVELNKAVQEIVPSVLQNGSKIEKSEVIANCFENKIPTTTKILSISDDNEITPKILVAENPEEQIYEVVTGYPFIQSKSIIKLKIIEINEWENLIEAVITGETKDKEKISFFDTNYFLNKETYEIGKIYDFSISAMAYAVEILEETSFSFEGQMQ